MVSVSTRSDIDVGPDLSAPSSLLPRRVNVTEWDAAAALPPMLSSSTKRRLPALDFDDDVDTENVDPNLMSPKRIKNHDDVSDLIPSKSWTVPPSKRSGLVLIDAQRSADLLKSPTKPLSSAPTSARPIAKPSSRRNRASTLLTGGSTQSTPSGTAGSTSIGTSSVPADRSLTSKRIGILNKKRPASPFVRIDPPSKSRRSGGLSLDAALGGTIPGYAARSPVVPAQSRSSRSVEKSMKSEWFFEIHEDTAEEHNLNMVSFSAGVLDISDDEDGKREKDDRGKENIPPDTISVAEGGDHHLVALTTNSSAPIQRAIADHASAKTRRDGVLKHTLVDPAHRAPLADLPPELFRDEFELSCDTFEIGTVAGEDEGPADEDELWSPHIDTVQSPVQQRPSFESEHPTLDSAEGRQEGQVQIWESGSAAGDEEQ